MAVGERAIEDSASGHSAHVLVTASRHGSQEPSPRLGGPLRFADRNFSLVFELSAWLHFDAKRVAVTWISVDVVNLARRLVRTLVHTERISPLSPSFS